MQIYYLGVLEVTSPKYVSLCKNHCVSRARLLSGTSRGESVFSFFQLLETTWYSWLTATFFHQQKPKTSDWILIILSNQSISLFCFLLPLLKTLVITLDLLGNIRKTSPLSVSWLRTCTPSVNLILLCHTS